MSSLTLDDQIKALLRKKAQVALFKQVEGYVDQLSESDEHPGITQEVQKTFKTFISTLVSNIERPLQGIGLNNAPPPSSSGHITSEAIQEVKNLANQVRPSPPPPPQRTLSAEEREEKIRFAMDNRQLAEKTLTAKSESGIVVTGKVVRLDAPYVFVQTKEGEVVPILPSTIQENA